MSKIQELLKGRTEQINYDEVIKKYPWVVERGHNCILSPDSDGLLCGLFMSTYLNWKIRGFYDGKIMLLDKDFSAKDCVFLDMEIFRKEIRSVGHHMVQYNKKKKPKNWDNFQNAIQPNIFRDYDCYKDFRLKYPLATIHLLIGIVGSTIKVDIPESAICPLLYVDGVFKNLFNYPENCLDWLRYLRTENKSNDLHFIFFNDYYSVYNLILALADLFKQIAEISKNKNRNDKMVISDSKGNPVNIDSNISNTYYLSAEEQGKTEKFIETLSQLTGWGYKRTNWNWGNFTLKKFAKSNIKPNNRNFESLIKKGPLSWAMTSGLVIEYTLDPKNIFLK